MFSHQQKITSHIYTQLQPDIGRPGLPAHVVQPGKVRRRPRLLVRPAEVQQPDQPEQEGGETRCF